jgi:hypothetical protein
MLFLSRALFSVADIAPRATFADFLSIIALRAAFAFSFLLLAAFLLAAFLSSAADIAL